MSWGRAAKPTVWRLWCAPSPRPVRGSAAGIGYLKVGEFTVAPPFPGVDNLVIDTKGIDPGLERRRSVGKGRAQLGEASGAVVGRERAEASGQGSATTDQVDLV